MFEGNALKKLSFVAVAGVLCGILCAHTSYAEDDKLIFMYTDLEPYVIVKNGAATGFIADYLNTTATAAKIKVRWEHVHWDRQIPVLKDNKSSVCAVALYKTPKRETYLQFSTPIGFDEGLALVARPNHAKLKNHRTFRAVINDASLRPILQQHSVYSPYVDELIKDKNFAVSKGSLGRLSRTLHSGKHDYMIITVPTAEHMRDQNNLNIYDHYEDLADQIPYHLACSMRTDRTLFDRLNAEFLRQGPVR